MVALLTELSVFDSAYTPSPLTSPLNQTSGSYAVKVRQSSQSAFQRLGAIAAAYGMTVTATTE